ncbi:MAG: alpha/beta fold family hydrolase [Hyphomonadaceae bacterium]|nr:MAG: alpha/beta fold family hydrolase [Hyphomonadaceae bacterium]
MVKKMSIGIFVVLGLVIVTGGAFSLYSKSKIEANWPKNGQSVSVMGVEANVVEQGNGPDVLMVHGASSNQREMIASLGDRLEGMHLIAPDRAGMGYSGRPEGAERLAVQAEFMAAILDAKGVKSVVAVGHSWGSAVVLRLALDRPDLVKSVVLIAPASHKWPGGTSKINRVAATPIIGDIFSWTVPSVFGPNMMPAGIAEGFHPQRVAPNYRQLVGLDLVLRPKTFRSNARDLRIGAEELAEQSKRYGELKIPITVVAGQGDKIVYNTIHAAGLVRDIGQARSFTVPNAGHMPHWAKPDFVASVIRAYAVGGGYPTNEVIVAGGVNVVR